MSCAHCKGEGWFSITRPGVAETVPCSKCRGKGSRCLEKGCACKAKPSAAEIERDLEARLARDVEQKEAALLAAGRILKHGTADAHHAEDAADLARWVVAFFATKRGAK